MNDKEREINLKLMFAYVFKQWRKIVIVTLVCGLLGLGYKLIKILPTYNSLTEVYNQNMESYEASTKAVADQKKKTQDIIDQLTEYSHKSIKANIDPYSEVQTSANISIVTTKGQDDFEALLSGTNHANQITQAYATYISKEISYTEIINKLGISDQLLKELINIGTNYDTDTITVTVIGTSEDTTKEIMNYILSQTREYEGNIRSEYGDYTAVISSPSTNIVADSGLLTPVSAQMMSSNAVMNDTLSKITTLNASLATISSSVTVKPISVNATIEKAATKNFALGIALGSIGTIILLAIIYILSGKLYSEEDIKLIPNAKVLAVIPSKKKDKRNTKFDRYLDKKIDSAYGVTESVAFEKAAANIEACIGGFKKLIIINANTDEDVECLKNKLQSINKDVDFEMSLDINSNADALKKLKDSDGVILLMKRNKTKFKDLSSIIETVDNWQKPIIGCILL